jgi:prepilin-type N-terminal cleavage/methylation domain-containing protein
LTSRGFTLLELLIVVVIIGILAAFAIPRFANTKEKAYVGQMKSDLRNISTAQEAFFYDSMKYTASKVQLNNFVESRGVTVNILFADSKGWSAEARHTQTARMCALYNGVVASPPAPATSEGHITCT